VLKKAAESKTVIRRRLTATTDPQGEDEIGRFK
jgi:hypothetical protein